MVRGRRLAKSGQGRALRERAGVSARELAAVLEVDPKTLIEWERGVATPRQINATRYAKILGELEEAIGAGSGGSS